ncbi:MAG: transporter substrate-binding domain-containing protein [Bacillota bacterium]|nr:transporter substrate-binding domain-containing protein [Bacillota bacterium]
MKKRIVALLSVAVMIISCFALTGCGSSDSDSDKDYSDLAYVKDKGTLVVGITDFAPMDYKDKDGNWIGFDADLAKAYGKSIGVDVEFIEINWDSKEMELENKNIDCVWNGMTLTDGVKEAMECSNAYCNNAQMVVVNKNKADSIKDIKDCKDLTFAVEAGSAGEEQAKENDLNATGVETQSDAVMEVSAGTADACIIDSLMAGAMVGEGTSYPNLVGTIKLSEELYGVGFRKESDMAKSLNEFLAAAYDDGTVKKISEKYGTSESVIKPE